jgi:hypothetical protein
MPIRTVPGALDLTNEAIASGSESTSPWCTIDPVWFTTQIDVCFNDTSVQHNIPLPLSIVARPHEVGLIRSWS